MTTAAEATRVELSLFKAQDEFFRAPEKYTAAVSGVGGGKTQVGVVRLLDIVANHPRVLGAVTAPTFRMLKDSTLRTVFEIFPSGSYQYHKSDERLEFVNGSEVLFRTTDDPELLRGLNLGFFWMDEAALSPKMAFEILQGRLRQKGMPHRGWITTTPKGYNWVYSEFAQKERDSYRMVRWPTRDNPHLPPGYLSSLEESYPDDFALQELMAEFIIVGGTQYFEHTMLKQMLDDTRDPVEERLGGAVKIWKTPRIAARYVAGGDLCWGETGAYSCMVIEDWQTGEQVAELYGRLPPDEMAQEAVKLCQEYNDAYVGMERNGEGRYVVEKMVELGYGDRMFYKDWNISHPETPGWQTDKANRYFMLGELEEAVRGMQIRPQCKDAVSEMMTFIRDDKGKPAHTEGAYDDHVIALAICRQMRQFARFRGSGAYVPVPLLW